MSLVQKFVCLAAVLPVVVVNGKAGGCLKQVDFEAGTVIIRNPGKYRLCENISFRPNFPVNMTDDDFENLFDVDFNKYSPNGYGLGFFAAIAIESDDVVLDLNGYTLEQSPEHALMQRFFALIELSSAPFIKHVGPSQFVGESEDLAAARNVVIKGPGTLGRSSHHGIHGNENRNVVIKNVDFRDFEVAAVSLNNVGGLIIRSCNILHNRRDVPVVGLFSAARFILPYIKKLMESGYSSFFRGEEVSASQVYDDLIRATKNVFEDVMDKGFIDANKHPEEYRLFDNPKRVVDGPCYGLLVHGMGPAVGDFGYLQSKKKSHISANVVMTNNKIHNITCWNNEVPAAVEQDRPVGDMRGAMLQFEKTFETSTSRYLAINEDGTYKGNIVADAQIMLANAVLENNITHSDELQIGFVNSIDETIVLWANGIDENFKVYTPKYRCNGDSMHHVIKGVVGIRVDKVTGFIIQLNDIKNITNLSEKPFGNCNDYHFVSPENKMEQQLGNVRGISVAAVKGFNETKPKQRMESFIKKNSVVGAFSEHANKIIGIDVQGVSSDVLIVDNVVDLEAEGIEKGPTDKMVGLRIRSHVGNCVGKRNVLMNGVVKEAVETGSVRRRVLTSLPEDHSPIEWNYGETPACPFARMQHTRTASMVG